MQQELKTLKTGESFDVNLQSRGALGLQFRHRLEPEGIVSVERIADEQVQAKAGDPLPLRFRVKAIKAGNCELEFYETRPWDTAFEPISQRRLLITVVD